MTATGNAAGGTIGMGARRCGTCLHYEPASTWRRGWCRNSLLFSPRQSHLVQDDDLDCSRGTEDFWEPRRDQPIPHSEMAGQANVRFPRPSPLKLFAPVPRRAALAGAGGTMMFASGPDDDDDDYGPAYDDRERTDGGRRATRTTSSRTVAGGGGRQRTVQFQPEERYWTEYLRIALPIIGLLLMIGLFWVWATSLIGNDGGTDETPTEIAGGIPALVDDPSTPVPSQTPAADAGQAPPPTTAPSASTPPADAPTEESAAGANPETSEEEEQDAADELVIGGNGVINEDGVRLRPDPSTDSDPLAELTVDTSVTINEGPEEAGDYRWWNVTVDDTGVTGWVVEDYLDAVPAT